MKTAIIRSYEPAEPGLLAHPNRVRESVCWVNTEGQLQEVGREAWWDFKNGFCYNYMGRGGIAWITEPNFTGDPHQPDKILPCPDQLNTQDES